MSGTKRTTMEHGLHDRERVGVHDFILLENYQSEEAFIENLRKRFQENIIYTYIGQVLLSVNPYTHLPIYDESNFDKFNNTNFYEVPPHIFAITDNAFRSLTEQNKGQCVLISGESGAGKTEASKHVLQYLAARSHHQSTMEAVKEKLLKSNPVLEAFGNAQTKRNSNSSRFGKYMDIQFDAAGTPVGGNILNYLLEKSRVVAQNEGERNFHIFYQLLTGSSEDILAKLHLTRHFPQYRYLAENHISNKSNDDSSNFENVKQAMSIIGFSHTDIHEIFNIIAAVLHLGNVNFEHDNNGNAEISGSLNSVNYAAELLGVDLEHLKLALTHRTIDAHGDVITSPLNNEQAYYARDALAKAVYDRLFSWLVSRINLSLQAKSANAAKSNVIGILDIYGFEVFEKNNFEQFCINYCNEKLQQLFIELTLKSEQEEYKREGIAWVPVKFFDNKVICNLIEERYRGIISILDEECLRPGDASDQSCLEKLNKNLANHPHYVCRTNNATMLQKKLARNEFCLVHYAGDVTYSINGFLDKNNDLLFRDLKETMSKSDNNIVHNCFPAEDCKNRRRPETAITQFKTSINNLIEILICKEPSYIRCIKPNDLQVPNVFNEQLVLHQVKYLGLMENLRVRRAGFAYRRNYDIFLNRYKCLSHETWPKYAGTAKEGVKLLVKQLNYGINEYALGQTKIFIRSPKTLFETEDAYQDKKHDIAAIIQARWKGIQQRRKYLAVRSLIISLQAQMRRVLAARALQQRREAVVKIRNFIKGFITRNEAPNEYNQEFIANLKRKWLLLLAENLPKTVLDTYWMPAPTHCQNASIILQNLHRLHLARVYRQNLTEEKKRSFKLKLLAESVFKDKKTSYTESFPIWFQENRISSEHLTAVNNFVAGHFGEEQLIYASPCTKYDRHGYKSRGRFLLLSNSAFYIIDGKTYKQKHRLPLEKIDCEITNHSDNLMVVRIPLELTKDKGDLILVVPYIIEFCTFLIDTVGTANILRIVDRDSLEHNMLKGKSGVIGIQTGDQPGIVRDKSGHLVVIAGQ